MAVLKAYISGQWVECGGGASALDGLSDVTITTPANGEALVYNGSAWVNDTVAGGVDIPYQADAPTSPSTGDLWMDSDAVNNASGSLLVAETVVSGSAVTSVTFSGLDGNAHGGYMLDFSVINANGSSATDMYLHVNGDTTVTNYYCEYNLISGSTNIVGNANTSAVASAPISDKCQGYTVVRCDNSRFNYMSFLTSHTTTNTRIFNIYGNKTADISNIASLTITASNASAIAIGSIFRLYRRK